MPIGKRTLRRMRQHVEQLADEHGITVTWVTSSWKAEAFPAGWHAAVPEIHGGDDYLVALHELGHVADDVARKRHRRTGRYDEVLVEGAAWAWAAEHADPALARRLGPADWISVASGFTSHLAYHAADRSGSSSHSAREASVRHSAATRAEGLRADDEDESTWR